MDQRRPSKVTWRGNQGMISRERDPSLSYGTKLIAITKSWLGEVGGEGGQRHSGVRWQNIFGKLQCGWILNAGTRELAVRATRKHGGHHLSRAMLRLTTHPEQDGEPWRGSEQRSSKARHVWDHCWGSLAPPTINFLVYICRQFHSFIKPRLVVSCWGCLDPSSTQPRSGCNLS